MPFACARALRVCALLILPASAIAQSTKSPTIFSATSQVGTVTVRAAVVLSDYTVKPLPLMRVVALRTDRPDSVAAQTDLDGRVSMSLRVGTYTMRAKTPQPVAGRSYAWAVRVIVRPQRTEQVQLTNSNASMADSVAVVAAAPAAPEPTIAQPAPPGPAAQKPAQPAGANTKVVTTPASAAPAPVATPKQTASSPAPATQPSPAQAITPASPTPIQSAPATAGQSSPFAGTSNQPAPAPARRVEAPKLRRTNTSGLMLGLSFDASSIRSDDLNSSTESGPGVAGTLGWGFTKNFALVIDASGARISSLDGDYDLAHVDLGGRWHFVNRSALVPFVEVGYAGRAARKQDAILSDGNGNTYTGELSILGSGVSAGGGFEYFPTPGLALGGSFKWTSGQFTQVKFDNVTIDGFKLDATSARFNMGFTWYPMRGGR
jgi:hypothetical protein